MKNARNTLRSWRIGKKSWKIYEAAGMDEARAQLEERWAAIPVEEVGRGPVVPAVDTEYRNVRRNQATELDTLLVSANEARAMLDGALAFALPNDPEIATRLAEIRRGRGNSDLAEDLLDLVALATQNYDVFSERVRISPEQLQRVAAVADRLLDALAFSSETPARETLFDVQRRRLGERRRPRRRPRRQLDARR